MTQTHAASPPRVTPPDAPSWTLYSSRQRAAFLAVLCLVGVSNAMDRNIIGVLIEQIKTEFQASDTMMGLLTGLSFSVFYATLGIPIARWADRGDRPLIITLSLAVWSVMTALCGLANTFWQLMQARFGVGAGEAGSIPAAQSLIAEYYAPTQRAQAIGIFTSSQSIGSAIGLALGGYVAYHYGWRTAFVVVALIGLLFVPLTYFVLKDSRRLQHSAAQQSHVESMPLAIRLLFAKAAYRNILAGIVTYYLMAYGVLAFIVSVMIRVHGQNVAVAGALFGLISSVAAVVGGIAGGMLADRMAARGIRWLALIPGYGLMLAIPFYQLGLAVDSLVYMVPLLVLATTVLAAVVPAMFSALHVVCGSNRRALSVATAFFFVNLIGVGLGPVVTGALSDWFAITHGSSDGLRYALMVMVLILAPAGYLMLRAARFLRADAED